MRDEMVLITAVPTLEPLFFFLQVIQTSCLLFPAS
jgi:hypothetical protein